MRDRIKELASLVGKGWLAVVSGLALGIYGVVQLIASSKATGWLWVAAGLAVVVAVALLAAYRALKERDDAEGSSGGTTIHQTIEGDVHGDNVTIVMPQPGSAAYTPPPPNAPPSEPVGPVDRPPDRAAMEKVKLSDYAEFVPGEPPVIRNRTFRNVLLLGPLLIFPRAHVGFREVSFGVNGDIDSMLWAVAAGPAKVGFVALENCIFDGCATDHIGVIGLPEDLERFKREVGAER